MRRSKFASPVELPEDMSLQITSMADIFTIVLVFLLKAQVSGMSSLSLDPHMVLPEARAQSHFRDALKVEVRREGVLVDERVATRLRDFTFRGEEGRDAAAGLGGLSEDVYRALLKARKQSGEGPAETRVLLLADERTPYATLNAVMSSAAAAGYVDLQLAVVQK